MTTMYQLSSASKGKSRFTSLARPCKLYSVPSHTAKRIDNHVASTSIGYVRGDGVRSDTEPSSIVEKERKGIVLLKEGLSLPEIYAGQRGSRGRTV